MVQRNLLLIFKAGHAWDLPHKRQSKQCDLTGIWLLTHFSCRICIQYTVIFMKPWLQLPINNYVQSAVLWILTSTGSRSYSIQDSFETLVIGTLWAELYSWLWHHFLSYSGCDSSYEHNYVYSCSWHHLIGSCFNFLVTELHLAVCQWSQFAVGSIPPSCQLWTIVTLVCIMSQINNGSPINSWAFFGFCPQKHTPISLFSICIYGRPTCLLRINHSLHPLSLATGHFVLLEKPNNRKIPLL